MRDHGGPWETKRICVVRRSSLANLGDLTLPLTGEPADQRRSSLPRRREPTEHRWNYGTNLLVKSTGPGTGLWRRRPRLVVRQQRLLAAVVRMFAVTRGCRL